MSRLPIRQTSSTRMFGPDGIPQGTAWWNYRLDFNFQLLLRNIPIYIFYRNRFIRKYLYCYKKIIDSLINVVCKLCVQYYRVCFCTQTCHISIKQRDVNINLCSIIIKLSSCVTSVSSYVTSALSCDTIIKLCDVSETLGDVSVTQISLSKTDELW